MLLLLPVYVKLFTIWWEFWHAVKMMADVKSVLNEADTLK